MTRPRESKEVLLREMWDGMEQPPEPEGYSREDHAADVAALQVNVPYTPRAKRASQQQALRAQRRARHAPKPPTNEELQAIIDEGGPMAGVVVEGLARRKYAEQARAHEEAFTDAMLTGRGAVTSPAVDENGSIIGESARVSLHESPPDIEAHAQPRPSRFRRLVFALVVALALAVLAAVLALSVWQGVT